MRHKIWALAPLFTALILTACHNTSASDIRHEYEQEQANIESLEEERSQPGAEEETIFDASAEAEGLIEDITEEVTKDLEMMQGESAEETSVQETSATPVSDALKEKGELSYSEFVASFAIPAQNGTPYVAVNDGVPLFTEEEKRSYRREDYGELDGFGRCTYAMACVGKETLPTKERGSIQGVKPTGWWQNKYDSIKDDDNMPGYLYNRCHLIAYCLTGQNDNVNNLITGTRYMNVEGMEPFELAILDYVEQTGNHVLYRVTPIFVGEEMLSRGVLMEAESIEDGTISFSVFCYNIQPGIGIDYATGNNWEE